MNDCAARPPKQSYQTFPGRHSTSPPSPRGAQPKTDRRPLPSHPNCNERASSMNSALPPDHRQSFCGASPRSA
jgi:hypothetical protein